MTSYVVEIQKYLGVLLYINIRSDILKIFRLLLSYCPFIYYEVRTNEPIHISHH